MTALHWAAYNDDSAVVKLLLEKGATSLCNNEDITPVDVAAVCLHWDTVQVFIDDLYEKFKKEAEDPARPPPVEIQQAHHRNDSSIGQATLLGQNDNKIMPENENGHDDSMKQALVRDNEPVYLDDKPIIEVDDDESHLDARIVYWAANLGELSIVKAAIDLRRMSPFIKCFK